MRVAAKTKYFGDMLESVRYFFADMICGACKPVLVSAVKSGDMTVMKINAQAFQALRYKAEKNFKNYIESIAWILHQAQTKGGWIDQALTIRIQHFLGIIRHLAQDLSTVGEDKVGQLLQTLKTVSSTYQYLGDQKMDETKQDQERQPQSSSMISIAPIELLELRQSIDDKSGREMPNVFPQGSMDRGQYYGTQPIYQGNQPLYQPPNPNQLPQQDLSQRRFITPIQPIVNPTSFPSLPVITQRVTPQLLPGSDWATEQAQQPQQQVPQLQQPQLQQPQQQQPQQQLPQQGYQQQQPYNQGYQWPMQASSRSQISASKLATPPDVEDDEAEGREKTTAVPTSRRSTTTKYVDIIAKLKKNEYGGMPVLLAGKAAREAELAMNPAKFKERVRTRLLHCGMDVGLFAMDEFGMFTGRMSLDGFKEKFESSISELR